MSAWTTTGRRRYRLQHTWSKGNLLVLQIEIRGIETTCIAGSIDSEWVNRWRDAKVSDITLDDLKVVME